ncbi:MAG: nucleotidyltransferase domain-containing protein [Desulfohalobiaceae bacterium]
MVDSKDFIIKDIQRYLVELKKHGIPVQRALLFGSWARGYPGEGSDVDVALISQSFSGDRFEDRRKIVPFRRMINSRIEPIPFTPQDLEMGGNLVDEILQHAEEIV